MSYPNPSTALASIVIDELMRGGVALAVIAPGSRSTALAVAINERDDLQTVVAIDERSAAYHAVGWSKATGRPAAVVTTSGTAVANLMPAVVEADAAGVRLVVVSADRPAELRSVGANQTIDQPGLFGAYVRRMLELGPAERHPDAPRWWRSSVSQAIAACQGWSGRPGPVHLNLAFREPTVAVADDGRTRDDPYPFHREGRPSGRPWTETLVGSGPDPAAIRRIGDLVTEAAAGLVIAGGGGAGGMEGAEHLAAHLGWPLLATAESNLRGRPGVIPTGHHLLGANPPPDLILRFGTPGPSRRMVDLLATETPQVVVADTWSDPGRHTEFLVGGDPGSFAAALLDHLPEREKGEWRDWWSRADRAVQEALSLELEGRLTEPAVAHALGSLGADRVAVASSMPIRDVEAYGFDVPPLVANRGTSGIDGFVSAALGMATTARSPLALAGDLSMFHDANGFLCDPRPNCVFVVMDNRGGGIFSFLPQAEHVGPGFERLFSTPPQRDLARLAEVHELRYATVEEETALREAVEEARAGGGGGMVVVRSDREENVTVHRQLEAVASAAIRQIKPPTPPSSLST